MSGAEGIRTLTSAMLLWSPSYPAYFRRFERADERARTAYPCSLRVRWELLTSVHHCTEIAIGMRIYVTTAHHCSPLSRSGCHQTVVSPIEVVNAPIHNLYVTYRTHSTNEQFWQCTGTD